MHIVAVLAMDNMVAFDLSTPCEVFRHARLANGRSAYNVRVCGLTSEVDVGFFRIKPQHDLTGLQGADTIIVPGIMDPYMPIPTAVTEALRTAATQGTRIAAICTGAFVIAAAGLLDGLRATTHWLTVTDLAHRYPMINVDPKPLYVDNGQILTSAGIAAGLDLCLHLIRRDYGTAVAADAARSVVIPLERAGDQAQYAAHEPLAAEGTSLQPLLLWLQKNLHRQLTLEDLARQAGMSQRTLARQFREQTGTSPLQWLLRSRLRQAQHLLETTEQSVNRIAERVGFTSVTTFRDRFRRLVGTSPQAYRRTFRE